MMRAGLKSCLLLLAALLAMALPARAQAPTKLIMIYTAGPAFLPAFVAQDQGFFARHGLAVSLVLTAFGNNIPASLVGGSAQIGTPTCAVFLQADDNGLDLLAVSGTQLYPAPYHQGILAGPDSGVKKPADLLGKRLGVSGIGGALDMQVRKFLKVNGVDETRVTRIEVPLTQMNDALRSHSVDAVVAIDPIFMRIADAGVGVPIGDVSTIIPDGSLSTVYAATRDWVAANPQTLAAWRAAMQDGIDFTAKPENEAASRESMARWTLLAPPIVQRMALPSNLIVAMKPAQLQFFYDLGREFDQLGPNLALDRLVAP
jgi:NitT/TauT family transport system substrate-binding protein